MTSKKSKAAKKSGARRQRRGIGKLSEPQREALLALQGLLKELPYERDCRYSDEVLLQLETNLLLAGAEVFEDGSARLVFDDGSARRREITVRIVEPAPPSLLDQICGR